MYTMHVYTRTEFCLETSSMHAYIQHVKIFPHSPMEPLPTVVEQMEATLLALWPLTVVMMDLCLLLYMEDKQEEHVLVMASGVDCDSLCVMVHKQDLLQLAYYINVYILFNIVPCSNLDAPRNGGVVYNYPEFPHGSGNRQANTLATYMCFSGFVLAGDTNRRCLSGSWSRSAPICPGTAIQLYMHEELEIAIA